MPKVKYTDYGLFVELRGQLDVEEVRRWSDQFADLVESFNEPFGVLVSVDHLVSIESGVREAAGSVVRALREVGKHCSAIIVDDSDLARRAKQVAARDGLDAVVRIFDAQQEGVRMQAEAWLQQCLCEVASSESDE